jgi:hypothetical protein
MLCPAASVKLLDKSYLHYVLAPKQPAPAEVLAVMQQQPSQRSKSPNSCSSTEQQAATSPPSALFSFAKGMAHVPQHVINAQVSFDRVL